MTRTVEIRIRLDLEALKAKLLKSKVQVLKDALKVATPAALTALAAVVSS